MFLGIYQTILMTLMFILSTISFSFMIASISKYLKNHKKNEIENKRKVLEQEIDALMSSINSADSKEAITKIMDEIKAKEEQIKNLGKKK